MYLIIKIVVTALTISACNESLFTKKEKGKSNVTIVEPAKNIFCCNKIEDSLRTIYGNRLLINKLAESESYKLWIYANEAEVGCELHGFIVSRKPNKCQISYCKLEQVIKQGCLVIEDIVCMKNGLLLIGAIGNGDGGYYDSKSLVLRWEFPSRLKFEYALNFSGNESNNNPNDDIHSRYIISKDHINFETYLNVGYDSLVDSKRIKIEK